MRILYAALRWDYGKPEQGNSFEHDTFYEALHSMGHELLYFDFGSLIRDKGRDAMNAYLWELVLAEQPELMFCVLHEDQLDPAVVRRISEETSTVTLNWFCDDHWRFYDFSRPWAPCFNWVVTTVSPEVAPYEEYGLFNVIRSQWACNTAVYHRPHEDLPLRYDVSFVGMAHGDRTGVIETLRRDGVDVQTWGSGWPAGRLTVKEMIRVFNQSRVNLNLANASVTVAQAERMRPEPSFLSSALRGTPGGPWALAAGRRVVNRLWRQPSSAPSSYIMQLKARTFEVPGSGGFLLTQLAPELERYLVPGDEIGTFHDAGDLLESVRHYLDDEGERHRVAEAGHSRVMRDHTYERRFAEIFEHIGFTEARS